MAFAGLALIGCGSEQGTPAPVIQPSAVPGESSAPERPGVALPDGGVSVFEPGMDAHRRNRGPEAAGAEFEIVSGEGSGFEEAVRGRVLAPLPEHPWHAQVATPVIEDLKAGQVLLLSLWARALASEADDGRGEFLVYFGTPGDENTLPGDGVEPAIYEKVKVGAEWRQLLLPVQLSRDYEKLKTSVNLDFGFAIQTLEFAGIQLHLYPDRRLEDLPTAVLGE